MDLDFASLRVRNILKQYRASDDGNEPRLDHEKQRAAVMILKKELLSAQVVHINKCQLATEELDILARAFKDASKPRPLKELALESNDISDDGFRTLARALKSAKLESLKVLDLSGNLIHKDGAESLGEALQFLPALETLKLQYNPIGVEGLKALATSFAHGHVPRLRDLRLGHTTLEGEIRSQLGEGTKQLASVLESGMLENLETLDLWHVGEKGVYYVMRAFQSAEVKPQLKSLVLSRNSIGREAVEKLAVALKRPALFSLRKLCLDGNVGIGDEGVLVLAKAFKKGMENLEYLSLTSISVGEIGMRKMAEVLGDGYLPSLQQLDMAYNNTVTEATTWEFLSAYRKNKFLVAKVNLDWPDKSLRDTVDWHKKNNAKLATQLKVLKNGQQEPAVHGKIFLCGEGGAGKSTLRKSLTRSWSEDLVPFKEVFPGSKQEPTRGIEVSHIGNKEVKLALWDLAGQSEYQVLHSTFLPDLAFAEGQATLFVIVCRLNFTAHGRKREKVQRVDEAKGDLQYWLRYIASSSVRRMESLKRHVVIVLNSYKYEDVVRDRDFWKSVLDDQRAKFGELLDIHPDPFVLDVRFNAKEVRGLKDHLQAKAKDLLRGKKIPQICKVIRKKARNLSKTGNRELFPVMEWSLFRNEFQQEGVNERILNASVEYLHEVGHIIYFREGSLKECGFPEKSFVVLNPEWFCKNVVGNLLLTQDMTGHKEGPPLRKKLEGDGSVRMTDLLNHMPDLNSGILDEEKAIILALLYRLGLIYKQGPDKVFIPALFESNGIVEVKSKPGWDYPVQEQCVMGSSLLLKESEITILPVSVLRKFQVELAQVEELTDYSVGLSHVTFNMDGMAVLVQFSEDGRNFEHASQRVGIRIDILVKPMLDNEQMPPKLRRSRQVNLVQVVVDKLDEISKTCCPGVQFVTKVIKPWNAEEQYEMEDRDVSVSIDEVKKYVQERGLGKVFRNWKVGSVIIRAEELLSERDLSDVYILTERRNQGIENVLQLLDIQLPVDSSFSDSYHIAPRHRDGNDHMRRSADRLEIYFRALERHLDRQFFAVHEHIAYNHRELMSRMEELLERLHAAVEQHDNLIRQVNSLEMFTVAVNSSSVPRFPYPMRSDPSAKTSKWKLRELLEGTVRDSCKLRFLCEAHHKDRSLHEVDGQEGIDINDWRAWVRKLAPCLVWSLKIAFVAAKVASNAILPGVSLLFPSDISFQSAIKSGQYTESVARLLKSALSAAPEKIYDEHCNVKQVLSESCGHEARASSRKALQDFLQTLSPLDFQLKIGLTKVALKRDSRVGFNDVVWICQPCLQAYSKRECNLVRVLD